MVSQNLPFGHLTFKVEGVCVHDDPEEDFDNGGEEKEDVPRFEVSVYNRKGDDNDEDSNEACFHSQPEVSCIFRSLLQQKDAAHELSHYDDKRGRPEAPAFSCHDFVSSDEGAVGIHGD